MSRSTFDSNVAAAGRVCGRTGTIVRVGGAERLFLGGIRNPVRGGTELS